MPFRLVHRYGRPDRWTFSGHQFQTVAAALDEARKRSASRVQGDFLIETEDGRIVVNDAKIAAYCHDL